MNNVIAIAVFLVGTAAGVAVVWLLMRAKLAGTIAQTTSELKTEIAALTARLAGREERVSQLEAEIKQRVEEARKQGAEKLALLEDAKTKLSDAFNSLASQALAKNNQSFLDLAKQNLANLQQQAQGELEQRKAAIEQLVKPVRESLEKLGGHVNEVEKERVGAYKELRAQVQSLSETQSQLRVETANLVKALRAPQVRGRWGEIQLKRVVELAGMLEYCDFNQQQTANTEDGRLRPDLLVRLPASKNIVVDAKTPLNAYLEALETSDENIRRIKLAEHATQVR